MKSIMNFVIDGDIEGFKEYLDSEAEAFAYCAGIGYGVDERARVERYPLRSSEETDLPLIEAIKLLMILRSSEGYRNTF